MRPKYIAVFFAALFLIVLTEFLPDAMAEQQPTAIEPELKSCEIGQLLESTKQLARALLHQERCHRNASSSDLRRSIRLLRDTLRGQGYSPVSLVLFPEQASAILPTAFPDDLLGNDDELWLSRGSYEIHVSAAGHETAIFSIDVGSEDRQVVPLTLTKAREATTTTIDIGQEPGSSLGEVSHSADMRDKEFDTLLADKYTRAPDPIIPGPESDDVRSRYWPAIPALASIGALATGLLLQHNGHRNLAFASYGTSVLLAGGGLYLLLSPSSDKKADSQAANIPAFGIAYSHSW